MLVDIQERLVKLCTHCPTKTGKNPNKMLVVRNIAVALKASTYVVERENLSKDDGGNTSNGGKGGRANQGASTGGDGHRGAEGTC
jgi:hypothetical protein